jgi:hypothetical protein
MHTNEIQNQIQNCGPNLCHYVYIGVCKQMINCSMHIECMSNLHHYANLVCVCVMCLGNA